MQIVYRDPKKHDILPHMNATSELCAKKKGKTTVFDFDGLVSEYQQAMLSGLFMTPSLPDRPLNVLHLGTGAGIMPSFLVSQLGDRLGKITTVDNSQDMLTIAKDFFGFSPDGEKIESVC